MVCTWFTLAVPGSGNRIYQHPVTFLVSPAGDHSLRSSGRKACPRSFLAVGKTSGREGVTPLGGGGLCAVDPEPCLLFSVDPYFHQGSMKRQREIH